jgi:hypothetical protein
MCAADKVWITELTLIHKYIRSVHSSMCKFICQSDVKHNMMSPIKTTTSVLKASTDIFSNIPTRPIGPTAILAILSVSTFKISVFFYISLTHSCLQPIKTHCTFYKPSVNYKARPLFYLQVFQPFNNTPLSTMPKYHH